MRCICITIMLTLAANAADLVAEGRNRFEVRCAGCHGSDGMGGERAGGIGEGDRSRVETDEQVRDLIREGIPNAGMPSFSVPDTELNQLVAFVRSRVVPLRETRRDGDASAGRAFFFGEGECSSCHMMKGTGGLTGPDLTGCADRLTLAEVESSLRKPGSRHVRGFGVATVKLRSGETLRGFVRNESGFDLQLQGFDNRLHLLSSGEIAEIQREPRSLMPPFHGDAAQIENVIAFLAHPGNPDPSMGVPELPDAIVWERIVNP